MGAFIIGGIIIVVTLGLALLQLFAAGMSDSASAARDAESAIWATLIIGGLLGAAAIGSHWLPHIGW